MALCRRQWLLLWWVLVPLRLLPGRLLAWRRVRLPCRLLLLCPWLYLLCRPCACLLHLRLPVDASVERIVIVIPAHGDARLG